MNVLSSFVAELAKDVLFALIDKIGIEGVTTILLSHKDRDRAIVILKTMYAVNDAAGKAALDAKFGRKE